MLREYLKIAALGGLVLGIFSGLRNEYLFNVLTMVGLQVLVVIGLSLLMGYAGQVSLGHAAFYGLGAYASGILTTRYGVSPLAGILLAQLFTLSLALVIGVPTLRLRGHYLALATLGLGVIVEIFFKEAVELTGGPSGLVGIPPLSAGGLIFLSFRQTFLLTWILVLLALLLSLHLIHSPWGRALLALHDSEPALRSLGYSIQRLKMGVFLFSVSLATLAGSLYAHFVTFISPYSFTFLHSVKFVTMVVVGGIASLWGAVAGAVFLALLPEVLTHFEDYEVAIFGIILILVMIYSPEGLITALERKLWPYVRSWSTAIPFSGRGPRKSAK
ncbi:branched-chain amino acid ABC transporter permease [Thermosulfurimonas marina]|uniref:Branched-chain amino acid ABC transporter permease n=1 Tax=Thermosulfurimonas marina TaxID=2047767 RepID=A0A6H1WR28_9BACT|nr:branched-chain amino acid ABC transporter permease [Thermosulfurimonas marina]QJA05596.1 branched-chain amino acid ABC transporter permease [Thermosulfurimonas marina]